MGRKLDYIKDLLFADMNTFRGNNGERLVQGLLEQLPEGYYILNDIIVTKEQGTSQIDHVVVSKYGIFVIETKNYSGTIYGYPNNPHWVQHLGNKKYKMYNPIMQNLGHIEALEKHLNLSADKFIPIECFSSTAKLKVKARGVMWPRYLVNYILGYKNEILTREEVIAIYYKLKDIELTEKDAKKNHIDYVNQVKK